MALGPRLAALDESRLAATEDWITARQHLGAGPELIGLLRRLTGEHPLRERLWSRLVAAVYAGGDAGGALTVYRQARAALVENLGIDPGPELAALHRPILARDPALTGPTGPLPSAAASSQHMSTSPKPPPAGEPQVRMTVQLDLRAIDLPLATQRLALAFSGLGIEPSVQASTRGGARPL
jgi:hypothetical protein